MNFFEENIKLLKKIDPSLAERVTNQPNLGDINIVNSKDGFPIPRIAGVSLHSQYNPIDEARKTIANFEYDPELKTIVYGLGFGYHVQALFEQYAGDIVVVEPLMAMFRGFISAIDIRPFLSRVRFRIGETPACLITRLEAKPWNIYRHPPSVRIGEPYYKKLDNGLEVSGLLKKHSLKVMIVNPIYGGSLPTAHYCADALKNIGHEIATVDCEEFAQGFSSLKEITKNPQNSEILSINFMKFMGEITAAKAAEFQPDLILVLAQAPLIPESVEKLKELNIPVAFWFVEDFRTLPYWKEVASVYDHIFTIQSGEFHDSLRNRGAQNCYYLPQACSPDVHQPSNKTGDHLNVFTTDVSFMGAAYHNRAQSFQRLLDYDFKIWGTGWDLGTPVGLRVQNKNKRLSPQEIVEIYNSSKINLNLHSSTYHDGINPDGDFVNPRTFEIAACKEFQLVDSRTELSRLFDIGEEVIVFNSLEEMRGQIDHFLFRPEERFEIALKSYSRVLKEHTMEHRMQELLLHVFLDRKSVLDSIGSRKRDPLDYCIDQAGEGSELALYLRQFKGRHPFSLKSVVTHIHEGRGALDQKETLLLMLDQILKEKV